MSDYEDGNNVLRRRPEPGRPAEPPKEKIAPEESKNVDVDAIAAAVVKAIGSKIPVMQEGSGKNNNFIDDFDDSKTLEKLAESMSVHGKGEESNFEGGLGKVKTTKREGEGVQNTIDLLSNIDEGE